MNTTRTKTRHAHNALHTSESMEPLRLKLKAADSEIQNYVTALDTENLRLQKHIAKLQADNVTLNNRITILLEDINERCVHETPPIECINKHLEQLEELRKKLEDKLKKRK